MGKSEFSTPIKTREIIIGWGWLVIHTFLLDYAVAWAGSVLQWDLDDARLNLVYYSVSFAFLLIFLFSFLKKSFSDLCDHPWRALASIVLCYAGYYAMSLAVNLLLGTVLESLLNPNDEAIQDTLFQNQNMIKAVAIFLGPVVEETLFRGVAFGSLRKWNRAAAYILSVLLFCTYHLWAFILADPSWANLLYLLQYIPGGIMLARCYERAQTIWAPIALHMFINFVSVTVQLIY